MNGRPTPAAQRRAMVAATFDQVAGSYDQGSVRWFTPIARRLVARLAPRPGERALDLGCGRGAALFAIAEKVGPTGKVTGIDLAPRMIEATRADARGRGLDNVELHVMDAAVPALPEAGYDLATASFVLFFLPAPVAALRAWRRLLVPGGRLGVSTFADDESGWLGEVFQPYLPPAGFRLPSPFSSDDRVESLFDAAGFSSIRTLSFDLSIAFADVSEWYAWSWSHGQRAVWERIPPAVHVQVLADADRVLARYRGPDGTIRLTHRIRLTAGARPADGHPGAPGQKPADSDINGAS
jgi:ubiquinone/menaquinone biosynthesis C-methylase UbiE